MELRVYPDRILRATCRPLLEITDADVARMREMLDFMYVSEGVGLAAPQVGWSAQVLTLDADGQRQDPRIFVNPRIVHAEGDVEHEEGCLSLPGLRVSVRRAEKITVVAYTDAGERLEMEVEGWPARVWQHEVDHLNGVLLLDHLDPVTLITLRHKLKELSQPAAKDDGC